MTNVQERIADASARSRHEWRACSYDHESPRKERTSDHLADPPNLPDRTNPRANPA